jgi:hypothetical protein
LHAFKTGNRREKNDSQENNDFVFGCFIIIRVYWRGGQHPGLQR